MAPSSPHPPDALVGRDTEIAHGQEAIDAVRAGGSRVLVVSGEPGIGKTALLDAFVARAAAAGLRTIAGRATEHETEVPFGLTIDALDDHVEAIDDERAAALGATLGGVLPALAAAAIVTAGAPDAAPPNAAQRFRVHRALRELVEELADGDGLALVLDDLHWADDASLEWVVHLLRRPPRRPHLLVLALRPVAPLAQLLDAQRSGVPGRHLELAPLRPEAAAVLLAGVAQARRPQLIREAAGNPLFLQELARVDAGADSDRLPATVLAAVELEVSARSPAARALLEGAAVAGDPFDAELAAAAAGFDAVPAAALDEVVAADLVRALDTGTALRFRHPLVRRAVHDATPPGARRAAHERAITALRARGVPPAGLAHHVERTARVGDAAAAELLVGAARATAARAPATAARWLRAALDITPGASPRERAATLAELATSLLAAGRQHEAHAALLEALALTGDGDGDGHGDLRLELTMAVAGVDHVLGRHDVARGRLLEALEQPGADEHAAARLRFELATAAAFMQDADEMDRWSGGLSDAMRAADPATAISDDALVTLSALWRCRPDQHGPALDALLARWAALDPTVLRERPGTAYHVGQAVALSQHLDEAWAIVTAGLDAVEAGGHDADLVLLTSLRTQLALMRGDARVARESALVCEEVARLQGADMGLGYALAARAAIAALDGDREDAARAAAEWPAVAERLGDTPLVRYGNCQFALLLAAEDPAACVDGLVRQGGRALEHTDPELATRQFPAYVAALLALGRRADADAAVDAVTAMAGRTGLPVSVGAAELARAEVLLDAGDAEGALVAAGVAAPAAAQRGYLDTWFHADLVAGRALSRLDRRDEAIAILRAAADRAAAASAWALRDTAARELRRLGSRLPTVLRVAGEEGDLTDRERQVAELVAAGRSNKEVAGLLFLSPKTVEHTLSRVYAKLGVRSRTELAAARAALDG